MSDTESPAVLAAPVATNQATADAVAQGYNTTASAFITGLLDLAVEDYSNDVAQEVSTVLWDPEPPVFEVDEELLLEDEDSLEADMVWSASYVDDEAEMVLDASCGDDDEDVVRVVSAADQLCADDVQHGFANEKALSLIGEMVCNIVSTSQAAVEADLITLPLASSLSPCSRPSFKRRLPPRQLPPMEEPFPIDCLPSSAPIALSVPPSAELAALRAAPPGKTYAEAPTSMPLMSTMPAPMPRPLSSEAEERLLRSAAAGLEGLLAAARLEAAGTIQRRWRQMQASRVLTKAKAALKEVAQVKEPVATFHLDAHDEPEARGTSARRMTSLANAYDALDAEVHHMADSDTEMKFARTPQARPHAPAVRASRPSTAPAPPSAPSGTPPSGRAVDPRRRMLGARTAVVHTTPARDAASSKEKSPGVLVPTPPSARPQTAPHAPPQPAPAAPHTPRLSRPGARVLLASTGGTLAAGSSSACPMPVKPPSTPRRFNGPSPRVEKAVVAETPASSAAEPSPTSSVVAATPRPPTTPKVPRSPAAPAGSSGSGSATVSPLRRRTPLSQVRQPSQPPVAASPVEEPVAASGATPTAMELDLGLPAGALGSAAPARPAAPGFRPFAAVDSPRTSKAVGTGLLPSLTTKVTKNGADSISWTVSSGGMATPRAPTPRKIDSTGAVF